MSKPAETQIYRIRPQMYIHVLDQITNVTRVEIGPKTLICKQHEHVVEGPSNMITIPPRHYALIENPIRKNKDGSIIFDENGQACLAYGEQEVRLPQDPFPLYPNEKLIGKITKLRMVYQDQALHLRCLQYFNIEGEEKNVGDEWLFEGPGQFVPNVCVEIVKEIKAAVIKQNQALRLRAIQNTIDREGNKRVAGEEWIVRKTGAYLPGVYEQVVNALNAYVLTDKKALQLRALRSFTDEFNINRRNGQQWLVTNIQTETYIPSVHEEVIGTVNITTLTSRQYCVIIDPFDEKLGFNHYGTKKLVVGEKSFFLQPGERLEKGIENVYVLDEEEGLILTCVERFTDVINNKKIERTPGDRWMIKGPMEFIPPIGAKVLRKNRAIGLHENEGIYIRNIKNGAIYAIIGETYLLSEDEELWEKRLPDDVEELLATDKGYIFLDRDLSDPEFIDKIRKKIEARDKTKVVRYNVPHNHAVQVFDFRDQKGRTVFGPALVLLQPFEVITTLTLSGNKPKAPRVIKCLHLRLGPEFSSDIVSVETSDHARLNVELSYNWKFEVKDQSDDAENSRLFSIEDFVGDMCKVVSSRVRAAVSQVAFDNFHKTSSKLIRISVFGINDNGDCNNTYQFPHNNLILTGIDIRSIEPEDPKTREALQKSVQLAIEISSKAQEATAKHAHSMREQEAKGKLERQKLIDDCEAEKARITYVERKAEVKAVETTGQARAEAQSYAESIRLAAKAYVETSKLISEAKKIELLAELEDIEKRQISELNYIKSKNQLSIFHNDKLSKIEIEKFDRIVQSIGSNTLKSIATTTPELRQKLMKGLGLESALFSDSIIGLFSDQQI